MPDLCPNRFARLGVGYCDEPEPPFTRIWFTPEILALLGEGFTCTTSAQLVEYRAEGDVIKRTAINEWAGRPTRIWRLTNEVNAEGCRLGVWPD